MVLCACAVGCQLLVHHVSIGWQDLILGWQMGCSYNHPSFAELHMVVLCLC
jgi:hypothetical protein